MDDSCAVCADALEWVAYGSCGHREVCSTCVARLRFICEDRRCCICKTESPVVFVTKALGDYTRMINDFALLPSEPREGRVGKYWYHEDTQAFFDDVDHYKMIKAMCRLSCSVCDKVDEEPNDGSKRRGKFRNIEQLKGHLFHQHRLFMCSLCLEGRKVFICEQRLYTRAQLNRHIKTGDSEVDGTESERGGFMGHPMCEFCKSPFYGDNELYSHMSTEHYTCHICQRQHPGQYEYYKNYDDLEIHFRQEHFLCEDEACLAKKFMVFQTEAEMKRHNTIEHGGRMSRSKRNAALQIPTSFRYSRGGDQDPRRGRGRTFRRDQSDDQFSVAIQASLETAHSEGTSHDPSLSSGARLVSDLGDRNDIDSLIQPLEVLTPTDPETSTRYLQALGQSSANAPLVESSFPPLPLASSSSQQKTNSEQESLPNNTMAAHLRRQRNRSGVVHSSTKAKTAASYGQVSSGPTHDWPTLNNTPLTGRSSTNGSVLPSNASSTQASTQAKTAASYGQVSSGPTHDWPTLNNTPLTGRSSTNGSVLPSYASSTQALTRTTAVHGHLSVSSSGNINGSSRISHAASAPNLTESGSLKPSSLDFPPVSATQIQRKPAGSKALMVGDVHTANKSLVEKMRAALEYDEDKYASFKDISLQYRQGSINTEKYLYYVQQYGLSHLVLELARLCPDLQKQKELVESYNANFRSDNQKENGCGHDNVHLKGSNGSKKGKGVVTGSSNSKDRLADSFMSTVRALQSNEKLQEEEVILSKDGYRATKGKSSVIIDEQQVESRSQNDSAPGGDGSNHSVRDGGGGNKQRKKTSKFHRVRLGDGSMAAILDANKSNSDPEPDSGPNPVADGLGAGNNPPGALPVRGVWRKGGGQKLFP